MLTIAALLAAMIATAGAQPAAPAEPANTINNPMAVPGFWDPRRRPERPDLSRILCDARILNIFEGAAEIQAQVIARRLLDGTN